jgi:hypothetical protein
MDDANDQLFMNVAQRAGDLDSLLQSFFGFLHRKTDLYIEQHGQNYAMGFAPGDAQKKVLAAFQKFPYKQGNALKVKGNAPTQSKPNKPQFVEVEHVNPEASISSPSSTSSPSNSNSISSAASSNATVTTSNGETKSSATKPSSTNKKRSGPTVRLTEEGKQIPVGNGGVTDRYYWTQTLHEVTVYVTVPPGTKAKDIFFKITPKSIQLSLKSNNNVMLIKGTLGGTTKHHEAMWTLEDREVIVLTLEKVVETWWKCIVLGDEEIDTTKVDSTRQVSDYDAETQAQIRKIMFDQRQKAKGLPTSEEIKTNDILERAKNLPGSPFTSEYLESHQAKINSTEGTMN